MISTDQDQSAYLERGVVKQRCPTKLGYQPALALHRLTPFDLEFMPNVESLQADARDPRDPLGP